jgi:Protein phosphatase inhibitor
MSAHTTDNAEGGYATAIATTTLSPPVATRTITLHMPRRQVQWTEETVDNEGMDKRKSKST